jgi:aconitase A
VVVVLYLRAAAVNAQGKEVFLRDIWPTREEIQAVEREFVIPSMFKEVYEKIEVADRPSLPRARLSPSPPSEGTVSLY